MLAFAVQLHVSPFSYMFGSSRTITGLAAKWRTKLVIKKSALLAFVILVGGLIVFTSKLMWVQTANSILLSDTFWDGNLAGWTTVDANRAIDGPSNWSVILAGSNYTFRQNSNI